MQPVKRIEIVCGARGVPAVCAALEAAGLSGWTVVPDVHGKGERGLQSGDELTDVFSNSLVLTTCPASDLDRVVAAIRPLLARHGGVCLVSDAQWVIH